MRRYRVMRARLLSCVAAGLFLLPALRADDTKTADADKGKQAVNEQLQKYKAEGGQVTQVKDESLSKVFPRYIFFTAHFRQYPIARALPEPLKYANIFAYSADGKLTLLNDPKAAEKFFKDNVASTKELDPAKDAIRAWLKLSPELMQDGFFKFAIMDDSTKAELIQDRVSASGKVVVMQGGNGEINAKLSFVEG